MAQYDLGKVTLTPRGNFDSTATYNYLDLVVHQGSSYVCVVKQSISGSIPSYDNSDWQLIAESFYIAYTMPTAAEIEAKSLTGKIIFLCTNIPIEGVADYVTLSSQVL